MANVKISDLAFATLPIDTVNTFFELQTIEGGVEVSRKLSAQDLGIGGGVTSVTGGTNIDVDNTDPQNPIINLPVNITGQQVNGVTLTAAGVATNYLDETGNYSTPAGVGSLQGAYDGGNTITINITPDPVLLSASVAGAVFEIQDTVAGIVMQVLDTGVIAGDPGLEASGINVGGTTYDSVLKASDIGGTNIAQFIMHRHSSSFGPFVVGSRSQGDTTAHVIVNDGDDLLRFWGVGWDGAQYQVGASMAFRVDGTPGAVDMPGEIVWSTTPDGSAVVAERMRLRQDGQLEVDNNVTLLERAAAFGSVATRGQIWVRNDAPTTLMFTDDAGSDVTLSIPFTATEDGLAPLSGGGTTNFLRADGTWAAPPGGGVTVEDEGTPLATVADTLNFVGAGVTATGAGTTKTITIPGAGAGTLAGLTDVDLTGQAQYDLFYNVDGTNWEDTGGVLRLDTASLFLELANGYGINMVDSGATSRPVLEIVSSGTPAVTIEHTTVEVVAEVSTTSTTEVDVTGGVLPVLTEGDEYLLIACGQHHQGNTGGENIHGANLAAATQSGVPFSNMRDDIEPPACAPASNQGQWFGGINQIQYSNATHGQIRLEHSAGTGATHYVNNAILMAFNLTDFGTENVDWFNSTTAPFVTVTDAGWTNLSPTITIGDGTSDWLIFGSFQIDQPSPATAQIQVGLYDGSTNTEYAMHEFEDTADIKSLFFSAVVTGIASTTFQTCARAVAASGGQARIFTSGIYALRLNRFAQYSIQSAAGPTNPGSGAEFSLLTDSVVATTASDWGIMAFAQNRWVGNTLSGTHYGRANINAGGFTTIAGFDTPPVSVVENAGAERTPKFLCPRITELTGVVATDTVGAELRWIPATTFATDESSLYNMVMFTWDTVDTSVEEVTVGDPALDTQIDGTTITASADVSLITGSFLQIFDAADSDSVQIEINTTTMAPNEAVVFQRNGTWGSGAVYSFDAALNVDIGAGYHVASSTGGLFFYRVGDAVSHSLRKDTDGVHLQVVAGRFRLTADSIQQGEVATPATNVAGQGQWWVRDHVPNQPWFTDDADIDYPVGYGRPRFFTTNASYDMNTGDNAENCINGQAYFDDGSNYTITLEDSGSLEFDVNTPFQIVNAGSGVISVAEGTGDTLFVLDGTAGTVTDAAGSADIGTGGVATVQRTAAGTWIMWGSGITP